MSKTVIHVSNGAKVSNVRVSKGENFSLVTTENEVQITKDGVSYTFPGKAAVLNGDRLYVDGKEVKDPWGTATKVDFEKKGDNIERKLILTVLITIVDMLLITFLTRVTEGTSFYFVVIALWVVLNIGLLMKALKA